MKIKINIQIMSIYIRDCVIKIFLLIVLLSFYYIFVLLYEN
jgi:hypothetical protein